jgi:hypothetical protein
MPKYFYRKDKTTHSDQIENLKNEIKDRDHAIKELVTSQKKLQIALDETMRKVDTLSVAGISSVNTQEDWKDVEESSDVYIPKADLQGEAEISVDPQVSDSNKEEVKKLRKKKA